MSPREPVARSESSPELQATPSMCHHCFDVLLDELKRSKRGKWITSSGTDSHKPEFLDSLPKETAECPLFVTWDKRRRRSTDDRFELRGCIGTLSPKPLASSIGEYALISALRDKRFDPVSVSELPHLRVAVSLLIQYEKCEHCHDWVVGIHGIMIRWSDDTRGSEYSATYLPEVASEQGWDQQAAVESLIRKAGYRGRITPDFLKEIQCTRYQSSKQRVSFDEYIQRLGHNPLHTRHGSGDARNGASSPSNCLIM